MSAENFDLVIVGATPGGIMTAVEAARMGKSSVILERKRPRRHRHSHTRRHDRTVLRVY